MRRSQVLAVALLVLLGCAESDHRLIEPELSFLGGRMWVSAATPAAGPDDLLVAYRDRNDDGRLSPMAEPYFSCERTAENRAPRCSMPSRRVVVQSYSSSDRLGARHEGLAIWVQDSSARPAAVPFCTQMGCSSEQPRFFDRHAGGDDKFHQYWICTPDPVGEIGTIELSVGDEVHRIEARPHVRLHAIQQWRAEGVRLTVASSETVSRAYIRVVRDGDTVWNSEQRGAYMDVVENEVTTVIPAAVASCTDASCSVLIDVVHIWDEQRELVTSSTHLEERLLPSSPAQ